MSEEKDKWYIFILSAILFVVFGFFQFAISLVLFLNGLDTCGEGHLEEWNHVRNSFFISLFFLLFQLGSCVVFIKKSTLESRFIWLIFPALTLILSVTFLKDFLAYDKYFQEFDKILWNQSEEKPISMIRVFNEEKTLHGLSKDQVIEMLGQPNCSQTMDSTKICYDTEGYESLLMLTFKNDTLVELYLECKELYYE